MKIEFVTKNYELTDRLREILTKKIEKLDKFFQTDTSIKVMLKQTKEIYTLELTIPLGSTVLRAEVFSDNMYNNIDVALPKLEKQIIKHHKRIAKRTKNIKDKIPAEYLSTEAPPNTLVKTKRYKLVPMTEDDAIEELELVGHNFYVFLNKFTNNVNIVYRRNDGDYGLIETEIGS